VKVLIIPEDQELDRYIVQPVIESLFADLEIKARIQVLPEPRLRGAGDALDKETIREIVDSNPMVDLFLLIVDADCDRKGNAAQARQRESEHSEKLIACVALQEAEVWLLALHKDQLDTRHFQEVQVECDPKERWAEPLLEKLGSAGPGHGRKAAMRALKGNYRSLRDTCTELRDLQERIKAFAGRYSGG
jgi:hypothetical protein